MANNNLLFIFLYIKYLILGSCSGLPVNDYVWGCWRIPKCFLGFKSCS